MNIYIWVWKFQTKYISSIMSGLSLQKEFYSMVHQELEKLYLQKPLDRLRREALFIILFLINKLFQDWKLALLIFFEKNSNLVFIFYGNKAYLSLYITIAFYLWVFNFHFLHIMLIQYIIFKLNNII